MPFSARWSRLAALLVAFALVLPAFAGNAFAQDAGEKVLRVHHPTYPDVFDPQKSSFTNEIDILALAYEGLTKLDTQQNTVPGAAESWEYNEDATQITFRLRDGLKYSDGSPLTAENFRYAVERTCSPRVAGEYQAILFEIKGCAELAGLGGDDPENPVEFTDEQYNDAVANLGAKVLDDRTLQLDLTNPAPYYHTIAYTWVFYPVKKEIAEADPDNWWTKAENHIGNGPFRIVSIEPDQQIRFEANDNYYEGRPKMDAIEYVYVDDAAVALDAYRNGELDMVQLEPPQIPEVQADPTLSEAYVSYPAVRTDMLGFNLNLEPFNDKKVREAFAYAFDRDTYCAEIRSGDCTSTLSWIPAGVPGAIETDKYAFDPEAAKAALAASSYGSADALPELTMAFNTDLSGNTERAEWVAGQYRDILGVDIQLAPTDGTTLTALRKDNSTFPQILLTNNWIQDYPDPQNWISVFWTCDSSFAKRVAYCNPQLDELAKKGDTTVNEDERFGYYEQAGQILIDDLPGVFLYNQLNTFVVNPAVTGYTPVSSEVEWPGSLASLMTIDKTD